MPAVHVEGLTGLSRAFRKADAELNKDLRSTLREVAEPVRVGAERLALSQIPRMTLPWSRMRVGVTAHAVYVAPKKRGTRIPQRKRTNVAILLLDRAMIPARDAGEGHIVEGLEHLLDRVGRAWEATPGG